MKRPSKPHAFVRLLVALSVLAFPTILAAQPYPSGPIRLIVGFAPGGATDLVARILAEQMSAQMGQPFVVENRGGAGGNIGADIVAKARPDGYTLMLATIGTMSINPTLYEHISFDPVRDFEPISQITSVPQVMVINPSLPVNNVNEFIAYAKEPGRSINYGSGGAGTATHLAGEMFNSMAGLSMTHVPYRGTGPAMVDLLRGEVSVMFDQIATSMPFVRDGKLRALGVTSATRSPVAPDLPTISESGLKGYDVLTYHGLVAPAGTPKPIIDRLNAEAAKALEAPSVRERFQANGIVATASTPEVFGELIKTERVRWKDIVKASGATVN